MDDAAWKNKGMIPMTKGNDTHTTNEHLGLSLAESRKSHGSTAVSRSKVS